MDYITGYFVDVEKGASDKRTILTGLKSYHQLLKCEYIDITSINIRGEKYTIVCDDESLLKDDPLISAVSEKEAKVLCGNIFVCKTNDENGQLISLTDDEIKIVDSCMWRCGKRVILIAELDEWNKGDAQ